MNNTLADIIEQINKQRGLLWTEEDKYEFGQLLVNQFCEIAHCNSHVDGIQLGMLVCQHLHIDIS